MNKNVHSRRPLPKTYNRKTSATKEAETTTTTTTMTTTMTLADEHTKDSDGLDTILDQMYGNQFECLYHVPCFQEFCKRALLILIFRYHNNTRAFRVVDEHARTSSTEVAPSPTTHIGDASDQTGRLFRLDVIRAKNTLLYTKRQQQSQSGRQGCKHLHRQQPTTTQQQFCNQPKQHQYQEEPKFIFPLFGGNALNCYLQFPFTIESQDIDFACVPTQSPSHSSPLQTSVYGNDSLFDELTQYVTVFQQNLISMIRRRFLAMMVEPRSSSSVTGKNGYGYPTLGLPYVEMITVPEKQKCSLFAVTNHDRRVLVGDFQLMQQLHYYWDQQLVYQPQLHFRHESTMPFLPWICCVTESCLAHMLYKSATHNADPTRRAMDQRRLAYMIQVCQTWGANTIWSPMATTTTTTTTTTRNDPGHKEVSIETTLNANQQVEAQHDVSTNQATIQMAWQKIRSIIESFRDDLDRFYRCVHGNLTQLQNKHTDNQQHVDYVLRPYLLQRQQKHRTRLSRLQTKVNRLNTQVHQWEKCKHTYEYYAHILGYEEIKKLLDNILSLRQFHPRYDTMQSDKNKDKENELINVTLSSEASIHADKTTKESSAQRRRRRKREQQQKKQCSTKPLSSLLEKAKESINDVQTHVHTYTQRIRQEESTQKLNAMEEHCFESPRFSITLHLAKHFQRYVETVYEWLETKTQITQMPLNSYMSSNAFYILRPYIDQWMDGYSPRFTPRYVAPNVHRYNPWLYFAEQMESYMMSAKASTSFDKQTNRNQSELDNDDDDDDDDDDEQDDTLIRRRDHSVTAWKLFRKTNAAIRKTSDESNTDNDSDNEKLTIGAAYIPNMTTQHTENHLGSDNETVTPGTIQDSQSAHEAFFKYYIQRLAPSVSSKMPLSLSGSEISYGLLKQQVHPDTIKFANRRVQEAITIIMQESHGSTYKRDRKISWVSLLDNLLKPYMEGIDQYIRQDIEFLNHVHPTKEDDARYKMLFEDPNTFSIYNEIISFIPLFLQACCFLQYMLQLKEIHRTTFVTMYGGARPRKERKTYYMQRLLASDLQKAFHSLENAMYSLIWYSTRSSEYTLYGMLLHVCIAYSQRARKDLQQQQQQE